MSNDAESRDYVLQVAKEHDVKFIRLWFTDILGSLKSVAITVEELAKALEEGIGFDGSSIEGFARLDESELIAHPDPAPFANSEGTALLDRGGYFDLTPLDAATDLRRETILILEQLGIMVEASHHEVPPSQHEIKHP